MKRIYISLLVGSTMTVQAGYWSKIIKNIFSSQPKYTFIDVELKAPEYEADPPSTSSIVIQAAETPKLIANNRDTTQSLDNSPIQVTYSSLREALQQDDKASYTHLIKTHSIEAVAEILQNPSSQYATNSTDRLPGIFLVSSPDALEQIAKKFKSDPDTLSTILNDTEEPTRKNTVLAYNQHFRRNEMIEKLIALGADPNKSNIWKQNAATMALRQSSPYATIYFEKNILTPKTLQKINSDDKLKKQAKVIGRKLSNERRKELSNELSKKRKKERSQTS